MPTAFLSHSSSDKRVTRRIAARLQECGIACWVDEAELRVGDSLIAKISQAIEEIDVVIAVLSKSSVVSQWVRRELEWALTREIESERVIVLPVVVDSCDVPLYLREKLYCDLSGGAFDEGMQRLQRDIRRQVGDPVDQPRATLSIGAAVPTADLYRSPALLLDLTLAAIGFVVLAVAYVARSVLALDPKALEVINAVMVFGLVTIAYCVADVFRVVLVRAARETNPVMASDLGSVPWTSPFMKRYRIVLRRHLRSPYVKGLVAIEILCLIILALLVWLAVRIFGAWLQTW